jgi:hypothetical protein
MPREAVPLDLGELHALPVLVPRFVARAEAEAPRLSRRALGRGDVGLKLHRVGARSARSRRRTHAPDRGCRRGLRHFGDDQAAPLIDGG